MKNISIKISFGFLAVTLLTLFVFNSNPAIAQKKKKQTDQVTTEKKIILTNQDGTSPYRILLPSTPTEHETKAAAVLQRSLIQNSGAGQFSMIFVDEIVVE